MILVNVALKKNGCRYDADNLKSGLDKIESYYLEDGWYRDGASGQKDLLYLICHALLRAFVFRGHGG